MTNSPLAQHSICLLATGDELINGIILNTDAQLMAQQCHDASINITAHMVIPDDIQQIKHAIEHLLQLSDTLIITGGLGPTCDDITRVALAEYLQQPLEFDDQTWSNIKARHSKINIETSEKNRQQAMFPHGVTILENIVGTAAGCKAVKNDKTIFMLPGPPHECLPMFERFVLPELTLHGDANKTLLRWRLFGIAESLLAEKLDPIANNYSCKTSYRWHYPYIDFSILIDKTADIENLSQKIQDTIAPFVISEVNQTASQMLIERLSSCDEKIYIIDKATGGALQSTIHTANTHQCLEFFNDVQDSDKFDVQIVISGLDEYWQANNDTGTTGLSIDMSSKNQQQKINKQIPFRNKLVKKYAVELAAYQILKFVGR